MARLLRAFLSAHLALKRSRVRSQHSTNCYFDSAQCLMLRTDLYFFYGDHLNNWDIPLEKDGRDEPKATFAGEGP